MGCRAEEADERVTSKAARSRRVVGLGAVGASSMKGSGEASWRSRSAQDSYSWGQAGISWRDG